MGYFDTLGNEDDEYRRKGRRLLKMGRPFGQDPMGPARQGRKRTGKTAGGWLEGWL